MELSKSNKGLGVGKVPIHFKEKSLFRKGNLFMKASAKGKRFSQL